MKPITILYADNDPEDRMLVKSALEESRLANDLRFVEDGEELMDYLRETGKYRWTESPRPGLILLDPNMPKKDARDAIAEIRADHTLRHIPIGILTTSEVEEDIYRGFGLGVDFFVPKPVTLQSFAQILKESTQHWFQIVEGALERG